MFTLCVVCLVLSFALTVLFTSNWIVSKVRNNRGFLSRKHSNSVITPFHYMIAAVFFAVTLVFIPIHYHELGASSVWSTLVKTPLLAAQNALQLFTINASFDNVREAIQTQIGISDNLADIYTVYVAFNFVFAPLLTGAVILSFVKGLYESIRYLRHKKISKLYVFSDLNEYSILLAEDILVNYIYRDEDVLTDDEKNNYKDVQPLPKGVQSDKRINRVVVFAGVTQKFQEDHEDLVAKARSLGAICLQRDITEINFKSPKRPIDRKLYLISDNEDDNVTKSLDLIKRCHDKYNFPNTYIYIFANSDESGIIIDAMMPNDFNVKVRRVNEKRNLIWNTLLKSRAEIENEYSIVDSQQVTALQPEKANMGVPFIFETARPNKGFYEIDVLLVGLGAYGSELLRTLSWFCQMPQYRVNVHVFDKDANCKEKIRAFAPELVKKNKVSPGLRKNGEAYYNLDFCNDAIDVNGTAFAEKISQLKNITLAFVTLGNDKINIDASIKLRRILGKRRDLSEIPPILTVVYNVDKTEYLHGGALFTGNNGKEDYGIRFVGNSSTRYSVSNIEQMRLERIGCACHMQWSSHDKKSWETNKQLYNLYEYNRYASMAQAMHLIARNRLETNGFSVDRKWWIRNEHNRWSTFLRADGFTYTPLKKDRSAVAKTHHLLKPFNNLPNYEKGKDDVELTALLKQYDDTESQLK